jgi:hypothetical protein
MYDLGNCKNSVGLKPNAEWKKDAKAPSYNIGAEFENTIIFINNEENKQYLQ